MPGSINFTWWNLQNFFDTDDDPISADFEFTPENGWTQPVFEAKRQNLADALKVTHGGALIELLAVCEIEKDELLEDLISHMGPEYEHLRVIHDLSGTSDLRGIDVAMAFDDRKLEFIESTSHLVHLRYRTRDLFEVRLRVVESGEDLVDIACHWPSRSHGQFASEPSRIAVAENVAFLLDNHVKVTPRKYEELRAIDDLATVQQPGKRRSWWSAISTINRTTEVSSGTCLPPTSWIASLARPMTSTTSARRPPRTGRKKRSRTTRCGSFCRPSRAVRTSSTVRPTSAFRTATRSSTRSS